MDVSYGKMLNHEWYWCWELSAQWLSLISQNISVGTQSPQGLGGYNQHFLTTGMTPFLLDTDCHSRWVS